MALYFLEPRGLHLPPGATKPEPTATKRVKTQKQHSHTLTVAIRWVNGTAYAKVSKHPPVGNADGLGLLLGQPRTTGNK